MRQNRTAGNGQRGAGVSGEPRLEDAREGRNGETGTHASIRYSDESAQRGGGDSYNARSVHWRRAGQFSTTPPNKEYADSARSPFDVPSSAGSGAR